jgi:hypothetical protein
MGNIANEQMAARNNMVWLLSHVEASSKYGPCGTPVRVFEDANLLMLLPPSNEIFVPASEPRFRFTAGAT